MRLLVVMNPSARDFEAQKNWPAMEPLLRQGHTLEVVNTDPDDAKTRELVTQGLQRGCDRVVAIGGDGTVHMVASALMRAGLKTLPQLGVIPFGTANNVAKCLGVPMDDHATQARIAAGNRMRGLDIGRLKASKAGAVKEHFWVNCVSMGMDADIVSSRAQYRSMGKYLSYAAALAERTLEQRSMDARVVVDGKERHERLFNAIVMNVPLYAGALPMPGASQDDGKLDLYLFDRNEYASKVLSYVVRQTDVLQVGVGDLLEDLTRNQRDMHGRNITIKVAFPRALQVDGEAMGEADELVMDVAAQVQAAGA